MLLQDRLQAGTLGVGQLAADPGHRAIGHVDQVAPRQRHLSREARALVTDRVLGDLDEYRVAGLHARVRCGAAARRALRRPS